jgi:hypothetical protein
MLRGEQRYSSTLSLTSVLEWAGWLALRPDRFTPDKETRYPLYRRLGKLQGRSGRVRKNLVFTGIRSPDCSVRSESLYRLSYPGPHNRSTSIKLRCFCWFLTHFMYPINAWNMEHIKLSLRHHHHHHHHHHLAVIEVDHLLTRSILTNQKSLQWSLQFKD